MSDFAILVKSFRGDYEYAARCIGSFVQHNPAGIELYIMVPDEDIALFSNLASEHVHLLAESLLQKYLTTQPLNGMRAGYVNQEIVKLAFWELGLAENYLCVDSDAMFIRPITPSDFMASENVPYSVLVEDKDLQIEPRYFAEHWITREAAMRRIQQEIGNTDPYLRTCHGHQVMSSAVLRDFRDSFLEPRGWTYLHALSIAPYEFTWYNYWLQQAQIIPVIAREPFAKVFHNEDQHLDAILRGVTVADIARAYPILVVNSNYSRDLGVIDPAGSKPELLGHYLSYAELARLAGAKARDTWGRRVRRSRWG